MSEPRTGVFKHQFVLGQHRYWDVVRVVRRSAPVTAWARRMGVNRITVQRLVTGQPEYARYAWEKLVRLVQSLEAGEWRWIGRSGTDGKWMWEGSASFERQAYQLVRTDAGFRVVMQ